jgi:hypothetical protein
VPRQCRPPSASQQLEAIVEAGGELLDAECRGARRRQLDRQRDAVEPPADRRDHRCTMPILRDMRPVRTRPNGEQLSCAVLQRIVLSLGILRRYGERWHRVGLLPLRSERLAAGGDDTQARAGAQHSLDHRRGGGDNMLAGVQHQQQLPIGERLRYALRRNLTRAKLEPDRSGNRGGNERGIGERRELDQPHPVGKLRQHSTCHREREPRLADAAGASQGDETMRGKAHDFAQLIVPADQLGNRPRQVRWRQCRCGLRRGHCRTGALGRAT